jgi:hypothetical protein
LSRKDNKGAVMNLQIRIKPLMPGIFLIFAAQVFLAVGASGAADECLSKPGTTAPQGGHWYYRVDRTTKRQCWYVGAERAKLRPRDQQALPSSATAFSADPPPQSAAKRQVAATAVPVNVATAVPVNNVRVTTIPVKPSAAEAPANNDSFVPVSSLGTSGVVTPDQTVRAGGLSVTPRADEHAIPQTSEDVGKTEHARASPITFLQLFALLASVLALVAVIGRIVFWPSGLRQPARTELRAEKPSDSASENSPKFRTANTRRRHAIIHATEPVMPESSAAVAEIERSVHRLLRELEKRQPRLYGEDVKRA